MSKFVFFIPAVMILFGCVSTAQQIETDSRSREYQLMDDGRPLTPISKDADELAIKGYDPVAFFTHAEGILGSEEYSFRYKDANWYFINEDNRKKFQESPDRFIPQYGGYCAFGVAVLSEMPPAAGDGRFWDIEDGKLYLKYNGTAQFFWRLSKKNMIYEADNRWPVYLEFFEDDTNLKLKE